MYVIEIHNFNECGHHHSHYYFSDEDTKGRMECLEERIKEFFGWGYKLDDVWQFNDEQGKPATCFSFFKRNERYCDAFAEITMRRIIEKKEYYYEC